MVATPKAKTAQPVYREGGDNDGGVQEEERGRGKGYKKGEGGYQKEGV